MQSFSIREIQEQKRIFQEDGYPTFEVKHEGRTYACFILPRKLEPKLKMFAMRMTPSIEEIRKETNWDSITLFGCSADVPKEFRSLWLRHEIHEFVFFGPNVKERCVRTAREELVHWIADEFRADLGSMERYRKLRLKFFTDLLNYGINENFPLEDLQEFLSTLHAFRNPGWAA